MDNSGKVNEKDIENMLKILDDFSAKEMSRMKVQVNEEHPEEAVKAYHHGRCDVGSPWAKGQSFDVIEE